MDSQEQHQEWILTELCRVQVIHTLSQDRYEEHIHELQEAILRSHSLVLNNLAGSDHPARNNTDKF